VALPICIEILCVATHKISNAQPKVMRAASMSAWFIAVSVKILGGGCVHYLAVVSAHASRAHQPPAARRTMHSSLVPLFLRQAYEQAEHKQKIDGRVSELLACGYASNTIRGHVREWLCFLESHSAEDGGLPDFEDPLVVRYLQRRCKTRKEGVRHVRAALRFLLCDEAAPGTHLKKQRARTPLFEMVVPDHLDFLRRHRGVRDTRTLEVYLLQFFLFLDGEGIQDPGSLRAGHYRAFLSSCASRMSKGTVSGVASALRSLARYLCLMGHSAEDLSRTIEAPRVYREHKPVRTLAVRDLDRLLDAVDRSDATGKRDYAMLLLAARYGLRPSDIRSLLLDDIHWRQGHLAIVQVKTGRPLELPLLADVEESLIDYIRDGRPQHDGREVFLRHKPPVQPLCSTNNLWQVMERGLRSAGLDAIGPGRGMRMLRHSAATQMMRQGIDWETIAGILGHVSSNTTRRYAHVDLESLRSVALAPAEVDL
jgi:site-specific recombinase XerD